MFSTIPSAQPFKFVQSIGLSKDKAVEKLKTLSERIKEIADYQRVSISELCRVLGVPPATMHGYINENREPKISFFQLIEKKFPNINLEWLITGKGTMIHHREYLLQVESEILILKEQLSVYKKLETARTTIDELQKEKKG